MIHDYLYSVDGQKLGYGKAGAVRIFLEVLTVMGHKRRMLAFLGVVVFGRLTGVHNQQLVDRARLWWAYVY